MQTFVPNNAERYTMTSENPESRKSVTGCCQKCKNVTVKPRQLLECGHQFCKGCLNEIFSSLSSWTDEPDYFACPVCGEKVSKPDFLIAKRSKAFSGKTKTQFYTNDSEYRPEQKEIENASDFVKENETRTSTDLRKASRSSEERPKFGEADNGSDFVNVRETSLGKSRSQHRTAVRFTSYKFAEGFNSRISSDSKDCVYFGGDIMPNGDIILADWLNFSLKLFASSGQFITSLTLEDAPLDITVVGDDLIVVSFGSTSRTVLFIEYVESSKALDKLSCDPLKGFLYGTTKFENSCLGIFEKNDKCPSIVQVKIDKSRRKSSASRRTVKDFIVTNSNAELSSESGIFYNHKDSNLYVTSRRKLLCFNKDRELIFKKHFNSVGDDLYYLGSVTCDDTGVTYIASDNCILRHTKKGVVAVIPTQENPYHLLMKKDQCTLVLIGKQCNVVCHNIEQKK